MKTATVTGLGEDFQKLEATASPMQTWIRTSKKNPWRKRKPTNVRTAASLARTARDRTLGKIPCRGTNSGSVGKKQSSFVRFVRKGANGRVTIIDTFSDSISTPCWVRRWWSHWRGRVRGGRVLAWPLWGILIFLFYPR